MKSNIRASRSFRKRIKKVVKAKAIDFPPCESNTPLDESLVIMTSFNAGQTEIICWEKDEIVQLRSDCSDLYDVTLKDSRHSFDFIIERVDSENVLVTVEGTVHKRTPMTKSQAHWEWDMIWNRLGKPEVLKEEVDGVIKVGKDGNAHTGSRGSDLVTRKKYVKRHDGEIVYYESSKGYYLKENGKLKYLGTKMTSPTLSK